MIMSHKHVTMAGLHNVHSVHMHKRPHHQFTTIAYMTNVIEVFLKKLTTSIVFFV